MQTFDIGNSLLGDELAIAQQLISDMLTCFAADVLDRALLAAEAPHKATSSGRGAPLLASKLTNLGFTALRLRTI